MGPQICVWPQAEVRESESPLQVRAKPGSEGVELLGEDEPPRERSWVQRPVVTSFPLGTMALQLQSLPVCFACCHSKISVSATSLPSEKCVAWLSFTPQFTAWAFLSVVTGSYSRHCIHYRTFPSSQRKPSYPLAVTLNFPTKWQPWATTHCFLLWYMDLLWAFPWPGSDNVWSFVTAAFMQQHRL